MSAKIIWNAEAVKDEAIGRDAKESPRVNKSGAELGRGATFLAAKRREILGDEALKAEAEEVAAWLSERLEGVVREMDVNVRPTAALVVAAAHLVERERLEEYRERIRSAQAERSHLYFLTSGPWPPYSFSSARS